jgi:hypothetical protein
MDFSLIVGAGIALAILEIGVCFVVGKLKQSANAKRNIDTNQFNS